MKKSILLLSVLALFLGACNSTKNGVAMKRKYNNGYYVSIKHKQPGVAVKETIANNKSEKTAIKPITPALLPVSTQEVQPQFYASLKNNVAPKKNEIKTTTSHKESTADIISKIASANNAKVNNSAKKQRVTKQTSKAADNGGVDLVILIILCLFPFINLIAMYLKDGKSFTMNFWIDLILDVLFFLPGIIFALLVVLDVVNLA
jgi:uncharacterized membrane protein YqaE (UPF0057 family)